MVGALMDNGAAYEAGGNIYFNVNSSPEYGKLSRNFGGDLLEGVRAEADPAEARPPRLYPVESRRTGARCQVGQPLGRRFPRLAH